MSAPMKEAETTPTVAINALVLLALMVLLGMTILLSFIDLDRFLPGRGWSTAAALTIAGAKAALVLAYFMHLRYGNRLSILFAGAGALWLGIMLVFLMTEAFIGQ